MRIFAPQILWTLLPFWAFLPLLWFALEKRALARFARFASLKILPNLIRGDTTQRRRSRFLLSWAAIFFAIIALSRPQLGTREETVQTQGLDVTFLLDVSNSMLTEDVVPSRLKKARHIIRNFIDH